MIDKFEDLQQAVNNKKAKFEVTGEAFELCAEVLRDQTSASGNDWSIVATNGWLALVTTFNHNIHRHFMKKITRDREDLRHVINRDYIIKKTDQADQYELLIRIKD